VNSPLSDLALTDNVRRFGADGSFPGKR